MNESASSRSRILERLHGIHSRSRFADQPEITEPQSPSWTTEEKISRLKSRMESAHSEVYCCSEREFDKVFRSVADEKSITSLLYAKNTQLGSRIHSLKQNNPEKLPELVNYDESIETMKKRIFSIDASITETLGGIAETGSLILWPSRDEPRLMSLIPPVHLAVLQAETIYHTFSEAIDEGGWSEKGMPTNALLISGPSKTADIEQTLVYGVHGPKQLVVFIIHSN
ncbi:MAG: lactate utilization protein [Nitrospinaceae bacterium]|nr:lactate utilization protein [Nitrospinaceae bacterium]